jgi:hypothetical protein
MGKSFKLVEKDSKKCLEIEQLAIEICCCGFLVETSVVMEFLYDPQAEDKGSDKEGELVS